MVYGFHKLDSCRGAEGVAREADGAWFMDGEEVGEHGQHVFPTAFCGVFGYVFQSLARVNFEERIVYEAHLPEADAQLLVAGVVDVG